MDADRTSPDEASEAVSPESAARRLSRLARGRLGGWSGWAAVATLVPLAALLLLQYRWLQGLERSSTIAQQATLDNYAAAIASAVEVRYRTLAERTLNLPPVIFVDERLPKAAYYFTKKSPEGAGKPFVVSFLGEKPGFAWQVDAASGQLVPLPWTAEARAVQVAVAPWKLLAAKGAVLDRPALSLEERDPEHRILLNPIAEESGRVVGVAGLILDAGYLQRELLPRVVEEALPKFFGKTRSAPPAVAVRDGRGATIFGDGENPRAADSAHRLGFPFPDHQIEIRSRQETPADWARRNLVINLALSALLAAAVAGGVVFAMRAGAKALRLSRMKSDFVSNVSHELRTPLASIRVFGELLRLGRVESPEKVRQYGEYIEVESRRLTRLLDNVLDLARIESGRKSYRLEPADLSVIVAEAVGTFRVSVEPAGFRVALADGDGALPPVALDETAIAQAIANLLDNAVKYSGDAREVEVGLRRDGRHAVVWVRDHGIGIPRDEQAKVFDRFHRVSTGLVHDVKGSGLGLAIVRHVAEAHGGRIAVESRPGTGSTFSIHLPLVASDGPAAAAAHPTGAAAARAFES